MSLLKGPKENKAGEKKTFVVVLSLNLSFFQRATTSQINFAITIESTNNSY